MNAKPKYLRVAKIISKERELAMKPKVSPEAPPKYTPGPEVYNDPSAKALLNHLGIKRCDVEAGVLKYFGTSAKKR